MESPAKPPYMDTYTNFHVPARVYWWCLLQYPSTGKLEEEKYTVYCNTEMEAAATKRVAKALVDCKVSNMILLYRVRYVT